MTYSNVQSSQSSPTEELPTLTPVPPTPIVETAGKIAFNTDHIDKYAIYVMNADGSAETRLTMPDISGSGGDLYPDWSR